MKKLRLFILIGLIATSIFLTSGITYAQSLDELQKRQSELDREIQENRRALTVKKQEVKDIETMISSLDNAIGSTEREISLSISKIEVASQKIDLLQAQITQKEEELKVQKENLYESIRVMYETPQQSTVEIIVGSNSLSEVVDRAQYIESLEYKIETTINTIYQLKTELENERNQIEKERTDLEGQKKSLEEKKSGLDLQKDQKNKLLNQSVAEKNNFQTALSQLMSEHSQISSEIYAQRRAAGGISFGSSGYPFGNVNVADPWLFLTRQCTSYVAWYWNVQLGKYWTNTQPGRGSARYWDEIAATLRGQGYNYTVSSTPRVGAIVAWRGPLFAGDMWGHVAIVEAVNVDGTINISEMNWVQYTYSYRTGVRPGDYGAYYYIY